MKILFWANKGIGLINRVSSYIEKFVKYIEIIKEYGRIDPIDWTIDRNNSIAFLTISKVAASSIRVCMSMEDVADDYSIHYLLTRTGMRCFGELTPEEKQYFKFTFVRNPFDRIVSCYESKYHTDRHKYNKKVLDFDDYLLGYIREDKGFDNFVKKIVRIPPKLMDRHFIIQYDWIYDDNGTCRVDYIGKYENIEKDFKWIKEKYNLKDLVHYNSSDKKNWMDYYNIKTAKMIWRKYKKDFKSFGYEDSYKELIAYLNNKRDKL